MLNLLIMTKNEHHQIYIQALNIYMKSGRHLFNELCYAIAEAVCTPNISFSDYRDISPYDHMELYPEIFKHKPADITLDNPRYWFSPHTLEGKQKHIDILHQAIEETKDA